MTPEQREAMRRRILDAARIRFLETGLDGLSMRGIAAKVGVSSMTLYLYYEGRQDIVRHIVAEGFDRLNWELRDAVETASPKKKLPSVCEAYVTFATENDAYYQAMFRYLAEHGKKSDELLDNLQKVSQQILAEMLGDGLKATALWSSLHGLAMLAIGGQVNEQQLADQVSLMAMLFRM